MIVSGGWSTVVNTTPSAVIDTSVTLGGKPTLKMLEADRFRFSKPIPFPTKLYVRTMFRLSPTHIAGKEYLFSKAGGSTGNYAPLVEYQSNPGNLRVSNGTGAAGWTSVAQAIATYRGVWHTGLFLFDWTGGAGGIPKTKAWFDNVLTHNVDYTFAITLPADNMNQLHLEQGGSQVVGTDAVNNYSHWHLTEFVDGNLHPAPYGPSFV